MRIFLTWLAVVTALTSCVGAVEAAPRRACLAPYEARQIVASQHLIEPLQVMRAMGSLSRAEPVSIKLCDWGQAYVYEVILLHREGRLLRVFVDGITGKTVSPKPEQGE